MYDDLNAIHGSLTTYVSVHSCDNLPNRTGSLSTCVSSLLSFIWHAIMMNHTLGSMVLNSNTVCIGTEHTCLPAAALFYPSTVCWLCSVCQNLDIRNDIEFLHKFTPQALVSPDRSVLWLQLCQSLRKHRLWRNAESKSTCLLKLTATWNAAPGR